RQGTFCGMVPAAHMAKDPTDPPMPICWIPRSVDNSSAGQVWVTSDKWAPLKGQLLHLSYGRCEWMLLLREHVEGIAQGGVAPLPGRFLSGIMRGRFSPHDGQLYVVGQNGWTTSATHDGCFQRIRYTGKPLNIPVAMHAKEGAIELSFSS